MSKSTLFALSALLVILALLAGCAQHGGAPASPYAGQQGREISAPSSGRSAASDGSVPAR